MTDAETAAERKRKRLEAWRKRQQRQVDAEAEPPATITGGFQTTLLPTATTATTSSVPSAPGAVKVKIGLGLSNIKGRKKKKKKVNLLVSSEEEKKKDDDDDDNDAEGGERRGGGLLPLLDAFELRGVNGVSGTDAGGSADGTNESKKRPATVTTGGDGNQQQQRQQQEEEEELSSKRRRRGRWDVKGESSNTLPNTRSGDAAANKASSAAAPLATFTTEEEEEGVNDALDAFMMRLEVGGDEKKPKKQSKVGMRKIGRIRRYSKHTKSFKTWEDIWIEGSKKEKVIQLNRRGSICITPNMLSTKRRQALAFAMHNCKLFRQYSFRNGTFKEPRSHGEFVLLLLLLLLLLCYMYQL